jgi:hypothetical protein
MSIAKNGFSWFRDLDSNQDTQLQRLMSYRLDDPGTVRQIVPDAYETLQRAPFAQFFPFCYSDSSYWKGEVSERFKEHAWKACVG